MFILETKVFDTFEFNQDKWLLFVYKYVLVPFKGCHSYNVPKSMVRV